MGPPVHQELLRRVASWIVRWRLSSLQRRPPALPGGAELRLEGALGLAVWPAAPPLCRHLLRRSGGCMAGERVLELGSGTGVVGLFAAALGAATVLTDCRPAGPRGAAVLERLRSNAEANAALCAVAPELLELEWGHHEQQQAVASRGPFSLLLGSDVTYRPASHAALLAAAARVCECPEAGGSRPPPLLLAHHSWGTALPSMLGLPDGPLEHLRKTAHDGGWSFEEVDRESTVSIIQLERRQ
ncbi:unnamed protein product [Prorocentrum cordatum]|uniref:Calmodulin-lysine N-methyltransferase n=1 Tax=Prorocentrum cordatum TaxID=2364126 RepID=A0ABN9UYG9_9DINO|nr:unnamed protein product [Polarella glacialis]